MKRRDFLKLAGIASFAPNILLSKPVDMKKEHIETFCKLVNWATQKRIENLMLYGDYPIGIALEDIPKDEYGWVRIF